MVNADEWMDGQTDGRRFDGYTTSSPCEPNYNNFYLQKTFLQLEKIAVCCKGMFM